MVHNVPLDDWISCEAIPFALDSSASFNAAVDQLIAALGKSVPLLGFGEVLHGGQDILILRNRLFQRLVEAHGYSAIAIESSFPRARAVHEYVSGHGPAAYDSLQESGFQSPLRRTELQSRARAVES
jgi:erythromycin esterase